MVGYRRVVFWNTAGRVMTKHYSFMYWALDHRIIHCRVRATRRIYLPIAGRIFMDTNYYMPRRCLSTNSHMSGSIFAEFRMSRCAPAASIILRIAVVPPTSIKSMPFRTLKDFKSMVSMPGGSQLVRGRSKDLSPCIKMDARSTDIWREVYRSQMMAPSLHGRRSPRCRLHLRLHFPQLSIMRRLFRNFQASMG